MRMNLLRGSKKAVDLISGLLVIVFRTEQSARLRTVMGLELSVSITASWLSLLKLMV